LGPMLHGRPRLSSRVWPAALSTPALLGVDDDDLTRPVAVLFVAKDVDVLILELRIGELVLLDLDIGDDVGGTVGLSFNARRSPCTRAREP